MVQQRRTSLINSQNQSRGRQLSQARQFRAEQLRNREEVQRIANEQDKLLQNASRNFQNINQLNQYYSSLAPEIRNRMKINPSQVKQQQEKEVSRIKQEIKANESRIKDQKERERRARDRGDDRRVQEERAREDRFIEENRALKEALKEIGKGNLISFNDARRFAIDRGRFEEQKSIQQAQQRTQQKDIAKQIKAGAGNVTSINYETGKVKVDGQEIKLSPKDVKDLQLTVVREAEGRKRLQALESVAKKGKTVAQLRNQGFSNKEIAEIGRFELLQNISEKSKERKLTNNELRTLNLTDSQIKLINQQGDLKVKDLKNVLTGSKEQQQRQLELINDIRERNKFFDKLTEESKKRLVDDFIEKLNNPPKSPLEVLGIYIDTRPIFDASPELRRDQEWNQYIRNKYIKAKQNPGIRASILGMGAIVSSAQVITTDFVIWTGELISTAYNTATDSDSRKKIVNNIIELNKKAQQNTLKENFNASKDFIGKGVNAVQSYFTELGKNAGRGDPFAIAEVVLLLAPIGVPIKTGKVAKGSKNINGVANELVQQVNPKTTFFDSKINYKQNLGKGSGTLKINTTGVTQKGLGFKNQVTLTYQPKNRTLRGTSKTTVGGTSTTKNINLVDRITFYEDKRNNIRIPKSRIQADNLRGKIVENSSRIQYTKKQQNVGFIGQLIVGERTKTVTKLAKQGKKIKTVSIEQRAVIEQALGINKLGEYVNEIARTGRIQTQVKGALKKAPQQRTPKDYANIVKMMEVLQWDKKILNGIDKRTRFGYALGLNKKSLPISIKQFENNLKEGYIVKRSGVAYAEASFTKMKPKKFALGPSFVFNNVNNKLLSLKNNKKAQVRLQVVQADPILKKAKKTQTGALRLPQQIEIPRIESLIFLPKKLNKGVKIPAKFRIIAKDLGVAQEYKLSTTQQLTIQQQVKQQVKQQTKIPQQIKELIKIQPKVEQKKIQRQIQRLALKNTPITIKNLDIKIPKIPRIPSKRIKGKTKTPIPKPKLRSKDKREFTKSRLGELSFVVRDKNTNRRRVINVKTGLPFKEAKNLGRKFVDNTILASFKVREYGSKKERLTLDKVDLSKFRSKRGKDPKVRELVEKRKYRLDKPNEVRQISQARIKKTIEDQAKRIANFLKKEEVKRRGKK